MRTSCRNCGLHNDGDTECCGGCGTLLEATCPDCAAPVILGKRFCADCGARLIDGDPAPVGPAESIPDAEYKPVSALFCDVVGSTALAERLGPEAMHIVLDDFFKAVVSEVHRYAGTVNKFLGDGFLALFGVPRTREDHARCAVLAALGLQQRLAHHPGTSIEGERIALSVRMGVNSGTAVVGKVGDDRQADYTAIGDTTNVAARLEAAAQPGEILISESTARLAAGYVTLEIVRPMALKGRSVPVLVFRVLAAGASRPPFHDLESPGPSAFVGRDRELDGLEDLFALTALGSGRAVSLAAEPGMGKSRLLLELRRRLAGRPVIFLEGRCSSVGDSVPYQAILDVIRTTLCGITTEMNREIAATRAAAALAELRMDAERHLPLLLSLLGLEQDGLGELSTEAVKAQTVEMLVAMVLRSGANSPAVLTVEDLHWVDATSEAFLHTLAGRLTDARLLLVTTHRTGYAPPWAGLDSSSEIALEPLAAGAARAMLGQILTDPGDELRSTILAQAEGNPFFIEELAKAHAETDVAGGAEAVIPESIQTVLMSRIDRLAPEQRRVLQVAAVLGREFDHELLGAVWQGHGELHEHLAELERLMFVDHRPVFGAPTLMFHHALTQDVAYASLLEVRRRALHDSAAAAIERIYEGRPAEAVELLAYHYSRAGRALEAVRYLRRGAELAARIHAHAEASHKLEQALLHAERLPVGQRDRQLVELTLLLADSLYFLGRFPDSAERLRRVREQVAAIDDPRLSGRYHFATGLVISHMGGAEGTREAASRAIDEAERCGDRATIGRAHYLLCRDAFWVSRLEASERHGRQAASYLEEGGESWWQGQALCFSSMALFHLGRFDQAIARATAGRDIAETMGDRRLQSYATWNLAQHHASQGDPNRGILEALRALELSPDPLNSAFSMYSLGNAYLEAGDPGHAIIQLQQSYDDLARFGHRKVAGWIGAVLADALLGDGRIAQAAPRARDALQAAIETGHVWGMALAERSVGRADLAAGHLDAAEAWLRRSCGTFVEIDARFEAARTHLDLARCAREQGRPAAVEEQLNHARILIRSLDLPRWQERVEIAAAILGADPPPQP